MFPVRAGLCDIVSLSCILVNLFAVSGPFWRSISANLAMTLTAGENVMGVSFVATLMVEAL